MAEKRRRIQVGAWTLVYSRRMDSQYVRTVTVAEVAVQFPASALDGRARGLRVELRRMWQKVPHLPA